MAFPATSCRACERRRSTLLPGDVLVLATDGIEARFADSLDISGSTQAISERILADHGKPSDDALVVAVRYLGAPAVIAGGGSGPGPFRAAYASALGEYLRDRNEDSLRTAYELGRDAVGRQLSVLDLAVAYQEALLSSLAGVSGSDGRRTT